MTLENLENLEIVRRIQNEINSSPLGRNIEALEKGIRKHVPAEKAEEIASFLKENASDIANDPQWDGAGPDSLRYRWPRMIQELAFFLR